jgi:hypothetical protein
MNNETVDTPTEILLSEIANRGRSQTRVAETYARFLPDWYGVDWPRVNQAIIARWSHAGLVRVKELAWKIAEAQS